MQQVSVSITAHVNGLFELLVMRFSISGLDVFAILSVLKEKVYILKGKKKGCEMFPFIIKSVKDDSYSIE